jgi:hypothetical protein
LSLDDLVDLVSPNATQRLINAWFDFLKKIQDDIFFKKYCYDNIFDQSKLCSLTRKTHDPSPTWVELLEGEIEKNIYSIKKRKKMS